MFPKRSIKRQVQHVEATKLNTSLSSVAVFSHFISLVIFQNKPQYEQTTLTTVSCDVVITLISVLSATRGT